MNDSPIAEACCKVLLIEDNDDHAILMENYLSMVETVSLEIVWVKTLEEALRIAQFEDYDIVLLDLVLPDSEGLDTFKKFHARHPHLPVVVNSSLGDETLAIEAVQAGAQDYLLKGEINPTILTRAILYALVRHEKDESLRQLALIDDLSQLYNRRGFTTVFSQCLTLARREGKDLLLIMIDVDDLKGINDTFGHGEGDRAIMDTAIILRDTFRSSDLIARIGGDEFVTVAVEASGDDAQGIRSRLQKRLDKYNQDNPNFTLGLSIGVTRFDPTEEVRIETLLDRADQDLYDQKEEKGIKP
jgi:diguanylate cyclase (GGDEF)-like protein